MASPWEAKCYSLNRQCQFIERQNLKLMNRIYHVKRMTKHAHKERKAIMNRLDLHNDNYRSYDSFFDTDVLKDSSVFKLLKPAKITNERLVPKMDINQTGSSVHASSKSTNAYLVFCQHARNDLLELKPSTSEMELAKLLAEKWANLKLKDKEEYYQMYEKSNSKRRLKDINEQLGDNLNNFESRRPDPESEERHSILSPNLESFGDTNDLQGNITLPQIPSPTLVDVDHTFGISNIPSPSFR